MIELLAAASVDIGTMGTPWDLQHIHPNQEPASIADRRFEPKRTLRTARCDQCNEWKRGNEAGTFCYRQNMPPTEKREAAWERGDWDVTWYCTECYMQYYNCSYAEVCEMLGFTGRAGKKARYAKGKA